MDMNNLKSMANRAGNTLYFAGAAAAEIGKEKGSQALQAASGAAAVGREKMKDSNAFKSATIAAAMGREKVKTSQAFQSASSAATVGKEKATTAASAAATVASTGRLKAVSALVLAKNRIAGLKTGNSPPPNEMPSAEKEFYKYEMSEDEKKKKRAQARRPSGC
ncbi:hypothetical protein BBO99_00001931 [Phytophthora kernoviae]|uniref:Uncharacterized protein n=1 Tax=Phytophthora kernoviae TaxID=325452 RepID=A0A3R7MU01_9STRA|nr:hypothetical protein JM18_004685 [Phytophthora kernoviae]RLN37513.1 hypothetical protein BBI17_001833 [Phytophthora kernoviae]RLN83630.1 hypothetical protein BBO99_00001931 [Phytophthora kernoviae]